MELTHGAEARESTAVGIFFTRVAIFLHSSPLLDIAPLTSLEQLSNIMAPIAIDAQTSSSPSQALKSTHTATKQSLDNLVDDPLARTYRSNREGTIKLSTRYPDFGDDKYAKRQWIKVSFAFLLYSPLLSHADDSAQLRNILLELLDGKHDISPISFKTVF